MDLGLKGKVVVLTGATGGIGHAICRIFLTEGARLAVFIRGSTDRAEPLLELASAVGGDREAVLPVVVDITDEDDIANGFARVLEHWDRVDILVNNAGTTLERPFLAIRDDEAREVAEVNLWGTLDMMRHALRWMMRQRSGVVVNISSVLARHGGRGVSVYAMSKSGLEAATRALAIEMAPKGVRLNSVAPGAIETRMSRSLKRKGDRVLDLIPMGRFGTPDEIAGTVAWLASDQTSYMTGQVVTLDGGFSL